MSVVYTDIVELKGENYHLIENPLTDIKWDEISDARWRGGKSQATWAQKGELFTKRDGTEGAAKGGEVAILKEDGDIAYILPESLARKDYDLSNMPKDKLNTDSVEITRKPEQVKVFSVGESIAIPSPFPEDGDVYRTLHPGDFIEYKAGGERPIRPVSAEEVESRYIPEEEALAVLEQMSRCKG